MAMPRRESHKSSRYNTVRDSAMAAPPAAIRTPAGCAWSISWHGSWQGNAMLKNTDDEATEEAHHLMLRSESQ
ncbi:hypothetical protein CN934_00585 [Ensifer sp. MMN_5]|nr:hypothetical protein CN934_00585 [Ensifer sp. MMN_5]PND28614.1 hypothetical protein CN933_00585 [Sinorhizobium sp. M4_45]